MKKEILALGLAGSLAFAVSGCGAASKSDTNPKPEQTKVPAACLSDKPNTAHLLGSDSDFKVTRCNAIGQAVFSHSNSDNPDFVQITFENTTNHASLGCIAIVNERSDAGSNFSCNWEAYNAQVAASTTSTSQLK